MASIQIKIINTSENQLPEYATSGSSGMDIRASLSTPLVLKQMQRGGSMTGWPVTGWRRWRKSFP
jgi:dUTP pyrophosphatase